MSKLVAVLKWLWACPLRGAILMGGATYFGLRLLPWSSEFSRKVAPVAYAVLLAFVGYFWQSALENERERRKP